MRRIIQFVNQSQFPVDEDERIQHKKPFLVSPHPSLSKAMSTHEDDVDLASLASSPSNHSKISKQSDEISPIPSPRSSLSRLSITSFSYNDMLVPLTTSTEDTTGHARLEKLKTVNYWSGLSLVVGLQIGSGIFSSPALVNRNAGSVGMSLIVWILAGCLAWTGACTSLIPSRCLY